jgi:YHS domain-containing protein
MQTKTLFYFIAAILAIALVGNMLIARDEEKKTETITCPVTGETVAKTEAKGPVTYEGKEYYFCCNSCVEKFKADPAKFITKPDELKTVCCGGMAVDQKTAIKVTYKEKDYYFCSKECKEKFEKDPEAYLEKVKMAKEHAGCQKSDECKSKCSAEKQKSCCEKK